jgi:hypothetical protein
MSWRSSTTSLLLLSAAAAQACITDNVPTRPFDASVVPSPGVDAAVDTGMPLPGQDAAGSGQDAAGPGQQEAGPALDSAFPPPPPGDGGPTPPAEGGVSNGPCELTGEWLITQRTVISALGVDQAGVYWFYYQIEQSGNEFTIKKGLQCGGQTNPITPLLSGSIAQEASWPGMLRYNPHAGRRGTITASGANCNVAFTRAVTVMGATCPYYLDESRPLPTTQASGSTPGWEDWDQDGQPGVTLNISSTLATGRRFTVVRIVNDWSGPFTPGATSFRLAADPFQIESVLGADDEILKGLGDATSNPSDHFAQFAKLQPGQVQGDDTAMCAKIRELAPMLTPEANR